MLNPKWQMGRWRNNQVVRSAICHLLFAICHLPSRMRSVLRYFLVIVTAAPAILVGSAAAVALTVTFEGFGTAVGARYSPDELIVPTVALPPVMPLTFQITEWFELFWTVAVNCLVRLMRTLAVVGEIVMVIAGAAVTLTYAVLDSSPSGVWTTTGTDGVAAGALPVAVNRAAETKVVARGVPSNQTSEPAENPTPSTVRVNAPAGIGDGLTDVMPGSGRIVTEELPVAVGVTVLAAPTMTVAGLGTASGAT
jgi:hypothetical protein